MRPSLNILALAVYATSALGYVVETFNCIDPQPYCCNLLTESGIGLNCLSTPLMDVYTLLAPNTTNLNQYSSEGGLQWASFCYLNILRSPMVPACCKMDFSNTTPDIRTSECTAPEKYLFQYDSETEELIFLDGVTGLANYDHAGGYGDPVSSFTDDDYYLYE